VFVSHRAPPPRIGEGQDADAEGQTNETFGDRSETAEPKPPGCWVLNFGGHVLHRCRHLRVTEVPVKRGMLAGPVRIASATSIEGILRSDGENVSSRARRRHPQWCERRAVECEERAPSATFAFFKWG